MTKMKYHRAHIVLFTIPNFRESTYAVKTRQVVMDPANIVLAFLVRYHGLNSMHHRRLSPLRPLITFGRLLGMR